MKTATMSRSSKSPSPQGQKRQARSPGRAVIPVGLHGAERVGNELAPLLHAIAHELRNPLFMISGYSQLAKERVSQGSRVDLCQDLTVIEEAAQRATAILERFLSVAKSRRRPHAFCDVNGLIRQALGEMAGDFRAHDITVETRLRPGLPRVLADHVALREVFLTLLATADAAMSVDRRRGPVTITSGLVSKRHQTWIEIRVADDTLGLSPQPRSRVFQPVAGGRLHQKGLGLGLPTASQLVARLGGSLTCEPSPAAGHTFVVRLPVLSLSTTLAVLGKASRLRAS
ncbi:MAG: sensor histidine kinase [Nitrospirales bacterium]